MPATVDTPAVVPAVEVEGAAKAESAPAKLTDRAFKPEESMTNFDKVIQFNKSFGVKCHETPAMDVFTADEKLCKLRLGLITEEVKELTDAMKDVRSFLSV